MRVGIDISPIGTNKAGIGYYTESLVKALSKLDKSNEYYLFTNDRNSVEELVLGSNFKIVEIKSTKPGFLWILKVVSYLGQNDFERFVSFTNFMFGFLFPNTLQFVYDLAPIKYPQFFPFKASFIYKILLDLCLTRVKAVATISHTVANEIVKYNKNTKNKIYFIGIGLHDWVYKNSTVEELKRVQKKYELPKKYILSVSTLEPRKNHIKMIEGFAKFLQKNPGYKYLIVGKKGWYFEEIFSLVERLNLSKDVIFLGYVPEEDLPCVYDQASGLMMLSFYEGFGLPLIEAYSRKIPVLASDIPVFREAMDEASVYVNPNNTDEIANGIEKTVKMQQISDTDFIEKYNWKFAAKNLINTILS